MYGGYFLSFESVCNLCGGCDLGFVAGKRRLLPDFCREKRRCEAGGPVLPDGAFSLELSQRRGPVVRLQGL